MEFPLFLWPAAWVLAWSAVVFGLFGVDKWRAARGGPRIAESTLLLLSACGGWPGGLAGILFFRHKSAKVGFQLRFAGALLAWLALGWTVLVVARVM